MSWYYKQLIGDIYEVTGPLAWYENREVDLQKLQAKFGVPQTLFGPFNTRADAQAFASAHPSPAVAAKSIIPDLSTALTNFGNTVVRLETRGIEAVVGIVLLAIAANVILKQLTGVDVAADTARAGKKAVSTGAKAAAAAAV